MKLCSRLLFLVEISAKMTILSM